MVTKLTLTMEDAVIDQAKEYAHEKNKSLSKVVEDYLKNVSGGYLVCAESEPLYAPITESLTGMFPDDGRGYKEMLEDARNERLQKYL